NWLLKIEWMNTYAAFSEDYLKQYFATGRWVPDGRTNWVVDSLPLLKAGVKDRYYQANVTYDGFVDTQNALKDAYQSSAVWMMKRTTWGNVLKLKDGESRPLINFEQLAEDPTRVVLGKRVLFADDMPVVASDALSVVFGDFGVGYTIVDRLGIRVLRDAFTNKPLVLFYTTKRVGGAVTNFEALKIMKLAA
ncbi:hypothetical protein LCGC14_2855060, partial [marine sediment metagenome]